MNNIESIRILLEKSISVKKEIIHNKNIVKKIANVIQLIDLVIKNNNCIYFCGNGGSAADAQDI